MPVPAKLFMCLRHWRMVPRNLQQAIWDAYVPGQEVRKDPTAAYCAAAEDAKLAVFRKETGIAASDSLEAHRILRERQVAGTQGDLFRREL